MVDIILAIILLSIIILVHEFGHFILAKANGVMVLEFCLGFGPKLVHFKKGETDYSIKLLPFGGACIMLGEDYDGNTNQNDSDKISNLDQTTMNDKIAESNKSMVSNYDATRSFANKSVWARISILAAGPIFNFLLAFILAVIILGNLGYDPCTVDKVYADSPATQAGLQEGDLITSLNGRSITFEREYSLYRVLFPEKKMEITYVRDGKSYNTTLVPQYTKTSSYRIGVLTSNCVINQVTKDSPAEKAGLKINDVIVSMNGQSLTNGDQIAEIINATGNQEINVIVQRDGNPVNIKVTPELTESQSYYTGILCYGARVKTTPLQTLGYGVKEVGYWIRSVFDSLGMLFRGKVTMNDVAGPVGVVNVIGNVVEQSKPEGAFYVMLNLFNMAVMISANLGVMNLLPVPALDGGRLVFCLIEAVRGKPINKEKEGMVHFVGMVLLMVLMVLILFNDIKNIFL